MNGVRRILQDGANGGPLAAFACLLLVLQAFLSGLGTAAAATVLPSFEICEGAGNGASPVRHAPPTPTPPEHGLACPCAPACVAAPLLLPAPPASGLVERCFPQRGAEPLPRAARTLPAALPPGLASPARGPPAPPIVRLV